MWTSNERYKSRDRDAGKLITLYAKQFLVDHGGSNDNNNGPAPEEIEMWRICVLVCVWGRFTTRNVLQVQIVQSCVGLGRLQFFFTFFFYSYVGCLFPFVSLRSNPHTFCFVGPHTAFQRTHAHNFYLDLWHGFSPVHSFCLYYGTPFAVEYYGFQRW